MPYLCSDSLQAADRLLPMWRHTADPEVGQLLPGSVIQHYRRGHLVLPGMLPGVLPGVTWALPGVYTWVFILKYFLCGPKISAFLKLKLLGKNQFPP